MSQKQLALLLASLIILTLIIKTLQPAISFTQDLGRHLKLGEIILQTKTVPTTNLFTYTNKDFPFVNHHWLSEVIFFLLYQLGGINSIIILKVILLTISFALSLVVAKRLASLASLELWRSGPYPAQPEKTGHSSLTIAAITSVFFLPVFLERTHIRPEIFSFLLFSLVLYLLLPKEKNPLAKNQGGKFSQSPLARLKMFIKKKVEGYHIFADRSGQANGLASLTSKLKSPTLNRSGQKNVDTRNLILIPLILLLWVNLHIYFAAGLALITFYVIEKIIRKEHIEKHLLLLIGSYTVVVLNPNGLAGTLEPLQIFKSYGYSIVENQTPFFLEKTLGTPTVLPFKISLVFVAIALVSSFRQKQVFAFLSLSFFSLLALKQIRNFPLYALTAIPFVSQSLAEQNKRISISNKLKAKSYKLTIILLTIAIFWQSYTAITALARTPPALGIPPHLHEPFNFFKNQKLSGPIFNNFNLAGLAIYHLYPQQLLFVDNRPEAFPPEFFQKVYIPMQQDLTIFNQIDNQYQFNTIIFQHIDITPWAEQFVGLITHHPDWAIIYLDERTMILVKKIAAPSEQIITEQNVIVKLSPLLNSNDRSALRNLLHLFVTANWPQAAQYTDQRLRFLPN